MDKNPKITVRFFSHLKDKAGVSAIDMEIAPETTIAGLKQQVIDRYPALETHLRNILILIDSKIAIDEDVIPAGCTVSFMTPIGGG
jgi:molybdopterin converting factor small subunit